ncbi:hypothetical protein AAMO2058_001713800 [Amorphochlora amoebiformis]|eukprot:1300647-Amorphochlora_amoeboformis.AAC.1
MVNAKDLLQHYKFFLPWLNKVNENRLLVYRPIASREPATLNSSARISASTSTPGSVPTCLPPSMITPSPTSLPAIRHERSDFRGTSQRERSDSQDPSQPIQALPRASVSECKSFSKHRMIPPLRAQRERMSISADPDVWLAKHSGLRIDYFPTVVDWIAELHLELFSQRESIRNTLASNAKSSISSPFRIVHLTTRYLCKFLSRYTAEDSIQNDRGSVPEAATQSKGTDSKGRENVTANRSGLGVRKCELQLIGVACYAIAVHVVTGTAAMRRMRINATRLAFYTDNAYTATQVLKAVKVVRLRLAMDDTRTSGLNPFHMVTPLDAVREIIPALNPLLESEFKRQALRSSLPNTLNSLNLFANKFVDICMLNAKSAAKYPSEIAAASVLCACEKVGFRVTHSLRRILAGFCLSMSIDRLLDAQGLVQRMELAAKAAETGQWSLIPRIEDLVPYPRRSSDPPHPNIIMYYKSKLLNWAARDSNKSRTTITHDKLFR